MVDLGDVEVRLVATAVLGVLLVLAVASFVLDAANLALGPLSPLLGAVVVALVVILVLGRERD